MKANHFEPALRPNHERSVVILCLNRMSFICLDMFMCHEVSHLYFGVSIQGNTCIKVVARL